MNKNKCKYCEDKAWFGNIGVLSRIRIEKRISNIVNVKDVHLKEKSVLSIGTENIDISFCPFCGKDLR